ncbi:TRAP transporter small permease [Acuticoccus sp. M5D2P5]|uniref:TRAP transporter small permease n=1 Tax=Acuticoccus kalidii TaxID=2910977 RepID=UPI001F20BC6B|nr:TRAP transporter small permease [Acuticoccus kalidii]MCF3936209.1 TRAP transporter small permease [Acuticoccus kalidii]
MRQKAGALSAILNRIVEFIVVIMMASLVMTVWIGVLDRYFFHWQLNWPEPLARYLMIWTVLLAISCAIARREHIGLTIVLDRLPHGLRRTLLIVCDLLAIALFLYVLWFGIQFTAQGFNRRALIFGLSMGPAFAAIPAAAALCALQLALVLVRDGGEQKLADQANEA